MGLHIGSTSGPRIQKHHCKMHIGSITLTLILAAAVASAETRAANVSGVLRDAVSEKSRVRSKSWLGVLFFFFLFLFLFLLPPFVTKNQSRSSVVARPFLSLPPALFQPRDLSNMHVPPPNFAPSTTTLHIQKNKIQYKY